MSDADSQRISAAEAGRIAGVSPETLKRWAEEDIVPVDGEGWTRASAAQARVVARMRERGYSLDAVKDAARRGRLAFGYAEDLFEVPEGMYTAAEVAERTGLEPELIERLMTLLGTPLGREGRLNDHDLRAMRHCADVLASGFPLIAFLQIVRVYAQSIRKIADTEVRLFHLYVHEPLMREGVPGMQIAEEMELLARDLLPLASPLMDFVHRRFLQHFLEQDVIGHMETDIEEGENGELGRVRMAIAFADLAGYTRFTEEEGEEEALSLVERFIEGVTNTLPEDARVIKTIGDEVMVVGPDVGALVDWAVGFSSLFQERPEPRIGIHWGTTVYRDGDYFGREVNLASRVVARARAGEVLVTDSVVEAVASSSHLRFEGIGEVKLKGFDEPRQLCRASAKEQ